jgi:hypothetical protein
MNKTTKFVVSWNSFISKLICNNQDFQNHLIFLQTLYELTPRGPTSVSLNNQSLSNVVSDGLRECDRAAFPLGFIGAMVGLKSQPWAIDYVKAMLRGLETAPNEPSSSTEDIDPNLKVLNL